MFRQHPASDRRCKELGQRSPPAFDRLNRLQRGATGGEDIIDDHHLVTWLQLSFHEFLTAMAFRLFANKETLQGSAVTMVGHQGGCCQGDCPDFQPAKCLELQISRGIVQPIS